MTESTIAADNSWVFVIDGGDHPGRRARAPIAAASNIPRTSAHLMPALIAKSPNNPAEALILVLCQVAVVSSSVG